MATNTNFQTPAQQLANTKELRIFGRGLGLSPDEVDELVTNFKAFDVDGSATVNRNELEKLFGKMLRGCVADSLIQKWVKASFKKADQNSNKELDILEFLKLYMSDFVHHVRDAKKQAAAAKKQETTEEETPQEDNGSSSRDLDFSSAAAAAPPAPVLLNLKLVKDGASHALSLPQDSTLASLKAEVQAKTGVPAEKQTLVFKGTELTSSSSNNDDDDAATLPSVGLKDGDSVELLQKVRVGVRGPDGKTAFLDANTSTSVAELKALVLKAKLSSAKAEDSLVLSHKGKPLSDNAATLAGLGVKDGETLDLAERLSLTVHIPGRGALTLTATSSVTATELLALIQAATGLATDKQALFHDGALLDGKAGLAGLRGTLSLGTTHTLLYVRKVTRFGEFVHLRGGQAGSRKPVRIAYTNQLNKATNHGNELSWAQATGSDWTTKPGSNEFHAPERHVGVLGFGNDPDNRKGDHYWKFDVDMPDSRVGDWIEFQAELQTLSGSIESEGDVKQPNAPFPAPHHYARVGYVTYVNFGEGSVESYPITF